MNIAIIGATGVVGSMMIKVLEEKNVKFDNLYLFASNKSAGKLIHAFGRNNVVLELNRKNLDKCKIDVALLSAGKEVSLDIIPYLKSKGTVCIDNSSAFRMANDVPLVVPEVNIEDIKVCDKVIANPNCSTIQAVVALNPLRVKYGLKRIVYSTYQAVSGAGKRGIDDLINTLNGKKNLKFPYSIANNCIPQIDDFNKKRYTKEEMKMIDETRKIFHDENLKVTATAVRVPVINSHSESINVELEKDILDEEEVLELYKSSKGIVLLDDINKCKYPLATIATGSDEVYVGRIRKDYSLNSGLNLWVVADNIRKGAASNAVQILIYMINNKMIRG